MKRRIQRGRGSERVTTVPEMKKVLHEEWDRITIEEINKEIAQLLTTLGASLSRAGIIITLKSLLARDTGRAGRGEEGWLQPMGAKEGGYQVFQVGNGSRGILLCHTGG